MSNRTIVELNHDYCPRDNARELIEWALHMRYYMGNADAAYLPNGVTFLHYRHHSEPSPLSSTWKDLRADRGYPTWVSTHAEKILADHKLDSGATRTSSGVAASTPTPIHDKLDAKVTT